MDNNLYITTKETEFLDINIDIVLIEYSHKWEL